MIGNSKPVGPQPLRRLRTGEARHLLVEDHGVEQSRRRGTARAPRRPDDASSTFQPCVRSTVRSMRRMSGSSSATRRGRMRPEVTTKDRRRGTMCRGTHDLPRPPEAPNPEAALSALVRGVRGRRLRAASATASSWPGARPPSASTAGPPRRSWAGPCPARCCRARTSSSAGCARASEVERLELDTLPPGRAHRARVAHHGAGAATTTAPSPT